MFIPEYQGTSPEGYSNWLAWAACEVDETKNQSVETEDDWIWREDLQCYERKEN